ncbi:collagen alpha-1(I) chain-like [Tiliqua scincoides]|uniref:collagen alpha-1(I) chain-like n=1 Tax=Tiliqua scincoides TaxID=71010 RepID=UPI0034622918
MAPPGLGTGWADFVAAKRPMAQPGPLPRPLQERQGHGHLLRPRRPPRGQGRESRLGCAVVPTFRARQGGGTVPEPRGATPPAARRRATEAGRGGAAEGHRGFPATPRPGCGRPGATPRPAAPPLPVEFSRRSGGRCIKAARREASRARGAGTVEQRSSSSSGGRRAQVPAEIPRRCGWCRPLPVSVQRRPGLPGPARRCWVKGPLLRPPDPSPAGEPSAERVPPSVSLRPRGPPSALWWRLGGERIPGPESPTGVREGVKAELWAGGRKVAGPVTKQEAICDEEGRPVGGGGEGPVGEVAPPLAFSAALAITPVLLPKPPWGHWCKELPCFGSPCCLPPHFFSSSSEPKALHRQTQCPREATFCSAADLAHGCGPCGGPLGSSPSRQSWRPRLPLHDAPTL